MNSTRGLRAFNFLSALIVGLIALGGAATARGAQGPIGGAAPAATIGADTTWDLAGSPYEINDIVHVDQGATLVIQPGVEVRFGSNGGLSVAGALRAEGSAEAPINLKGATEAQWRGLIVAGTTADPASITLRHVTIERGGYAGVGDALYLEHARATITRSSIVGAGRHGINGAGDAGGAVSDSTFSGNGGYPIRLSDLSVPSTLQGVSAQGNGQDEIGLGGIGSVSRDDTWENAGVPYRVVGLVEVGPGAALTIEPGVELRFAQNTSMQVAGALRAEGMADAPIRFTGAASPGSWQGIVFYGTPSAPAIGTLRHAVVEYGGGANAANIYVNNGQVAIRDSVVRGSAGAGIMLWSHAGGSSVERSQIVENGGYGVFMPKGTSWQAVMAANNWWGHASGPNIDNGCNPGGQGARVSGGVVATPFLGGPEAQPGAIEPADARLLTITPRRLFAPASGTARVYVEITLRDGAGMPIAGRTVRLHSTLGSVVDGGITDVQGRTFASLTSTAAGDAELTAQLDLDGACEYARSATSSVTFTPDTAEAGLGPEAVAPYLNGTISASPTPFIKGVPTTLSAQLSNPSDTPLTVEGSFGFAQSGIGLTFGPIGEPQRLVIPPHGSVTFSTAFTPPIAGHYCFTFEYTYGPAEGAGPSGNATLAAGGRMQINLNYSSDRGNFPHFLQGVRPSNAPMLSWHPEGIDAEARNNWRWVGGLLNGLFQSFSNSNNGPLPEYGGNSVSNSELAALSEAAALPDFRQIAKPRALSLPEVQPGGGVSQARADASNRLTNALIEALVNLEAASAASERYHMATEANDLRWASLQASAADYYGQMVATTLPAAADAMDAYRQVLVAEGEGALPVSVAQARAFQERLRTQGFTQGEIAGRRQLGMDDAAIEADRLRLLALTPEQLSGDLVALLAEEAQSYRLMAGDLRAAARFAGPASGASLAAEAGAHRLTSAGTVEERILIGNPYAQQTTINLKLRPIDLPPDWIVSVSPATLTLDPGEQQEVTVSIVPGTAVQGSVAQVAVEGYAGATLIDGVAFSVLVPERLEFSRPFAVGLPLLGR
jgi:hypothetical protein